MKNLGILLFIGPIFFTSLRAYSEVIYEQKVKIDQFKILEDSASAFDSKYILKTIKSKPLQSIRQLPKLSGSSFWFYATIINQSIDSILYLKIDQSNLDEVTYYHTKDSKVDSIKYLGEQYPFYARDYDAPSHIVRLYAPHDKEVPILFKIKNTDVIHVPVYVGTKDVIFTDEKIKLLCWSIYTGVMFVMIFYNLFIYFSIRDNSYLFYIINLFIIYFAQTQLFGFPYKFFWSDFPMFSRYGSFLLPSLAAISGLVFIRHFLQGKKYLKKFDIIFPIVIMFLLISMLLGIANQFSMSYFSLQLGQLLTGFLIISSIVIVLTKGGPSSKYLLIGWLIFVIGTTIYVLQESGVIVENVFTVYAMTTGSIFETIFFSFALADKINVYKKERYIALKEKESILKNQGDVLKEEVKKQTKELKHLQVELERQISTAQLDSKFMTDAFDIIDKVIKESDKLKAQQYLSRFSRFMRYLLNSSLKAKMTLSEEVKAVTTYLEIEKIRLEHVFEFQITINQAINPTAVEIPSMTMISILESLIWQEILALKKEDIALEINFEQVDERIRCVISINEPFLNSENAKESLVQRIENQLKSSYQLFGVGYDLGVQANSIREDDFSGTQVTFSMPTIS